MEEKVEIRFRKKEIQRQKKIYQKMSPEEKRNIRKNRRFLQFCDDLSIALCLHEPMQDPHPWFHKGIQYNDTSYQWVWKGKDIIGLFPKLFTSPFTIKLPYIVVGKDRKIREKRKQELFVS
jgi:hypothetical protein